MIRRVGCNRLSAEVASEAVRTGNQYRIDERLGECKLFHQVVVRSLERTMRKFGVEQPESDGPAMLCVVGIRHDHQRVPGPNSSVRSPTFPSRCSGLGDHGLE